MEHWKGFQKSTKETKKQLKHAAHTVVHPKKAQEEKQKVKEKAEEEENARQEHEEEQHTKAVATASSSLKPEDVKDKALREKIEKMRVKKEQEDEQWKSGSQWRWEVITGRAKQTKREQEQKWKSAMESVAPSSSTENAPHQESNPADPPTAPNGQAPATTMKHADSGYASAETPAVSQAHPRELGKEVPKVDPVPEEGSPVTPEERPPAYDATESSRAPVEKSIPPQ